MSSNYSFIESHVKAKGRGAIWEQVDVSNVTFKDINDLYNNVLFVLAHSALEHDVTVNLDTVRTKVDNIDMTVTEFLEVNGNSVLEGAAGRPVFNTTSALYSDYTRLPIKPIQAKMGQHPTLDLTDGDKPDVLLQMTGLDPYVVYDNTLVTINGLFHRTSASPHGIYVVDGDISSNIANRKNCGLLDFSRLGGIKIVDIDSTMLYRPHQDNRYYNTAYLNIGEETFNKTVLLVIGGYLHALDKTYRTVGDGLIKIDFMNYPHIQRYFESRKLINLNSLPITDLEDGDVVFREELVESEAYIEALLDLSQTFAVVLDNDDVFVRHHKLQGSKIPKLYHTSHYPCWPLMSVRGQYLEYIPHPGDGRWVINTTDNRLSDYQFEHEDWRNRSMITVARNPTKPFKVDNGFFVEIGRKSYEVKVE